MIALDHPGFGESPGLPPGSGRSFTAGSGQSPASGGPVVPGSVDHFAGLVADFLDQLGLQRPELAGSSLGGGIALEPGRRGRASAVTAFAPVDSWARRAGAGAGRWSAAPAC